jgi:hypothetical protein
MDALIRDFRLAVRSLLRVPLFSAVAVRTLGIGLGTTSLMFTPANAAFLQPQVSQLSSAFLPAPPSPASPAMRQHLSAWCL